MTSTAALLSNPYVVSSIGLHTIIEGLPPTLESGEILGAISTALQSELPPQAGAKFNRVREQFSDLLRIGGTPSAFQEKQAALARLIKRLQPNAIPRILDGAGFQSSPSQFASRYEVVSRLRDVLLRVDTNMGHSIERLADLVAIPSISAPGHPFKEVQRSADWVANALRKAGFRDVRTLCVREAHPTVYGKIQVDDSKPTVVLYAHHDVQPIGERKEWTTDPFRAVVRKGRLYGRGPADDKGGFMAALAAIEAYQKAGVELPCNIIMIVEGEEEIGSLHLGEILSELGSDLKPDAVLLIDAENIRSGHPTITLSTRGVVRMLVEVQTLKKSVHSGVKGGPVLDALSALGRILDRTRDENLELRIPGVTDRPLPIREDIRRLLETLPSSEPEFRETTGVFEGSKLLGNPRWPIHARIGRDYSLAVLAVEGTQPWGEVAGIVVPRARANVELRVPPGGDVEAAARSLETLLRTDPPFRAKVRVQTGMAIKPWESPLPLSNPVLRTLASALTLGYGRECILGSCGGGIGFLPYWETKFPGVPMLPIGIEDPYTDAHGTDESLNLEDFANTQRGIAIFLALMGGYETK